MKKCFFLILMLTINGFFSNGQSIIGLTGGYNNSVFFDKADTPHYSGEYESQPTYCISAFLKQRNHKYVNLSSEISFVNRVLDLEARYGGLGFQIMRKEHYTLNYLYVSLLPELSFGRSFMFNFCAGPAFGFLVNSHVRGSSSSYDILGNYDNWTEEGSANSDFNGFVVRLFAAIGLEIPIRNKFKMTINSSFSRGISNIANGGIGSYAEFISTNDLSLTLGVIYKLDKFTFSPFPKLKDHSKN